MVNQILLDYKIAAYSGLDRAVDLIRLPSNFDYKIGCARQ